MFMQTRYSLSVARLIIFFSRGEFTIIARFSLYIWSEFSTNFKSDCMSPKRALIAPLVPILVWGLVLSSYTMRITSMETYTIQNLLRNATLFLWSIWIFIKLLLLICLITRSLTHSVFLIKPFNVPSDFWNSIFRDTVFLRCCQFCRKYFSSTQQTTILSVE